MRQTMLRLVRNAADRFIALASPAEAWEQPTACAQWQVSDIVGHLIDVTESYFVGFDAAESWRSASAKALGCTAI
jgi:hypothetical protein